MDRRQSWLSRFPLVHYAFNAVMLLILAFMAWSVILGFAETLGLR